MTVQSPQIADVDLDAAVEWMLRLREDDLSVDERRAFEQWNAEPRHRAALEKLGQASAYFDVPGRLGVNLNTVLAELADKGVGRRTALRRLAVGVIGLGVGGWALREAVSVLNLDASVRTPTGKRQVFWLADRSQLTLNARTAVDVDYGGADRRIRLRTGEILATISPDPRRLFVIETPHGSVRAHVGGAQVRLARANTVVGAASGAVSIVTAEGAHMALAAGQDTTFDRAAIAAPRPADFGETAWVRGYYVALNKPLSEVVDSLRPYRPGIISVAPDVAGLRISGVFPLDRPDAALKALADVVPIRVDQPGPYWTRISAA